MAKYLFYIAFFCFCYYAGNKAYPTTTNPTTTEIRTTIQADSSKMQSFIPIQGSLYVQQGSQEQPVSSGIKQQINKVITESHKRINSMPGMIARDINPAQDSMLRQASTRSLAFLNEANK